MTAPGRHARPPSEPEDGPRELQHDPRGAEDGPKGPRDMPKAGHRGGTKGSGRPPRGTQDPPEAPNALRTPERPNKWLQEARKTAPMKPQTRLPRAPLQASWATWISTATARESIYIYIYTYIHACTHNEWTEHYAHITAEHSTANNTRISFVADHRVS